LIAVALSRTERTEDYAWGLQQLLEATKFAENEESKFAYPGTIMIDEEAAMEAACCEVLMDNTEMVSCIWHMERNIQLQIKRKLKEEYIETFMEGFRAARDAITEDVFNIHWMKLCRQFGGNGHGERLEVAVAGSGRSAPGKPNKNDIGSDKDEEQKVLSDSKVIPLIDKDDAIFAPYEWGSFGLYLRRMRRRRHHWAAPWVARIFTAGMRSTQRVEMTNNMIKMLGVNNNTDIVQLLVLIELKLDRDSTFHVIDEAADRSKHLSTVIEGDFQMVLAGSKHILGTYASSKLKSELASSYGFISQEVVMGNILQENLEVG
jgi:hypothetical protein